MPDQLTTNQLEAIQRLISDPLRQAVRAEMQAGHERLAAAIEKVADQLAGHVAEALRHDTTRDSRLSAIEHRLTALERFRGRVLIVYAALTLLVSLAWELLREWLAGTLRKH
jgi:hypothetical protein